MVCASLYSVSPVIWGSPSSTNSTMPSTSPSEMMGAATAAQYTYFLLHFRTKGWIMDPVKICRRKSHIMNRLISLALSVFLLLSVGCVCRAAPLPPQEEGAIQSSVLHTQAPPGEAAVPAGESVQEPAGGADAPALSTLLSGNARGNR